MRDTIDMAREAGVIPYVFASIDEECLSRLKAFEALVRADERSVEREACAKFFDLNDTNLFWGSQAAQYTRTRETHD